MSIIILDSNEGSLNRCKSILNNVDLSEEVLYTVFPEQAMSWFSKEVISVFITEMNLDVMSCVEISEMLRMLHPETVLLLMTEVDYTESVVPYLNEGDFYEIILKPLRFTEDLEQPITNALKEHAIRKAKIDDENTLKKTKEKIIDARRQVQIDVKKREKDVSNICRFIQGVCDANIRHSLELGKYDEAERKLFNKFIERVMVEYLNCFVFRKYSFEEYEKKIKNDFGTIDSDNKVELRLMEPEQLDNQAGVRALFGVYVLAELATLLLGRFSLMTSIEYKEQTIITKAICDLNYSKVDGKLIYNTNNTSVMEQMHTFAYNILSSKYNKVVKGYNDNPFFFATVLST